MLWYAAKLDDHLDSSRLTLLLLQVLDTAKYKVSCLPKDKLLPVTGQDLSEST